MGRRHAGLSPGQHLPARRGGPDGGDDPPAAGDPGAYLAAAIFALHPVQVESVAWITELKNTLSAVFYLGAALLYLRFDQARGRAAWYLAALGLFVLALASKTMTATLPGALLVIFWWQRGRLSWKKDVLPLAPFFLLGGGHGDDYGMVGTEDQQVRRAGVRVHAAGADSDRRAGGLVSPGEAVLAGKPDLYLSALADQLEHVVAVLVSGRRGGLIGPMWLIRRRTRGPLAAAVVFWRHAFPGLGFLQPVHVPVFPHRRPLPVPGVPGNHHAILGRCGVAFDACRGLGQGVRTDGLRGAGGLAGRPEPGGSATCTPISRRCIRRRSTGIPTATWPTIISVSSWPAAARSTRRSHITGRP